MNQTNPANKKLVLDQINTWKSRQSKPIAVYLEVGERHATYFILSDLDPNSASAAIVRTVSEEASKNPSVRSFKLTLYDHLTNNEDEWRLSGYVLFDVPIGVSGWAWTCDACCTTFHRDEVRCLGKLGSWKVPCAVCGKLDESPNALSADQAEHARARRAAENDQQEAPR